MPELRWRADKQVFELFGESTYTAEFHGLSSDDQDVQDRLFRFLSKYWEREQWADYSPEVMLRTSIRLVALDRSHQDNLRIGFTGYWPEENDAEPETAGFVELEPLHPEDKKAAKHGVTRLSEFIQRVDRPVLCTAEIWLRENHRTGAMKLSNMTVQLPYEDDIAPTIKAYGGPTAEPEIQQSTGEASLHAAIYDNGVDRGASIVRWDQQKQEVTIYPPSRTEWGPSCMHEFEKIKRHLDQHVPRHVEHLELALIPRPDNDYDQEAISVALPKAYGSSPDDRHIAYLYKRYKDPRLGQLLADLARYSGGEIRCFGEVERGKYVSKPIEPLLPFAGMLEDDVIDFLEHPDTPPLKDQPTIRKLLGLKRHKGLPQESENKRQQALKSMTHFSS